MFPFNLPGEVFIVFYVLAAVVAVGCATLAAREASAAAPSRLPLLTDPYDIAFVRARSDEVVRVAVLSLIDRGLIEWNATDDTIVATRWAEAAQPKHLVEREILAVVREPTPARALLGARLDASVESAVRAPLERAGHLENRFPDMLREPRLLAAWLGVTALAAAKIVVALAHLRFNVLFLLAAWVVATLWLVKGGQPTAGKVVLHHLGILLANLRHRAASLVPGRATNELALVAATFGFDAVPERLAPYAKGIQRELRRKREGGGSNSGCGGGGDGDGGGGGCGGCGGG